MLHTSISHPLQIAEIGVRPGWGKVGLTLCPGKKQDFAITGKWDRDIDLDVSAIAAWKAAVVVTLLEPHEMVRLQIPQQRVKAAHMDWVHLPIADRGVPGDTFELAWIDVGEGLRARLRAGFNVLVHCMGGLGRAGTIACRLLIELGWKADAAVSEVRRVRAGAIETEGQIEAVLSYVPVPEHVPAAGKRVIHDRAVGSMVGLAMGDALGTTVEFKQRDSFPMLTDMTGGGPFGLEPGQWTDDTSMALALADSLAACNGLDEHDLMKRFYDWYEHGTYSSTGRCFDIGATTRRALIRFEHSGNPIAGGTDPMSAGNGSLMRLAPIAIRYWQDREGLRDAAARQSRTTHAATEAVDACVAFAERLADAIAGKPRSEVLDCRVSQLAPAITTIEGGTWRGKHRDSIKTSGYVVHSLEAAMWCVARTATFEDAVLLAANLGDDADTVAAITGQLAGAIYASERMKPTWLGKLTTLDDIRKFASKIFAL